jgi:single-stranded DNA-binding protein
MAKGHQNEVTLVGTVTRVFNLNKGESDKQSSLGFIVGVEVEASGGKLVRHQQLVKVFGDLAEDVDKDVDEEVPVRVVGRLRSVPREDEQAGSRIWVAEVVVDADNGSVEFPDERDVDLFPPRQDDDRTRGGGRRSGGGDGRRAARGSGDGGSRRSGGDGDGGGRPARGAAEGGSKRSGGGSGDGGRQAGGGRRR